MHQLIDTGPLNTFGWELLFSLVDGSYVEKIAMLVADGSGLTDNAWKRVYEAAKKNLRNWQKGQQPRQNTVQDMVDRLILGIKLDLAKDKSLRLVEKERYFEQLDQATDEVPGPFSALANIFSPTELTPAKENLLSFSRRLDNLNGELSELRKTATLEECKNCLCSAIWLDDAYWRFSEDEYDDADLNRRRLWAATNQAQFAQAAGVLQLIMLLSWLAKFDLATTAENDSKVGRIPLFLPLIARFTAAGRQAVNDENAFQITMVYAPQNTCDKRD